MKKVSSTKTLLTLACLAGIFLSNSPEALAQACCPDGAATITAFAGTGSFGYTGDGGPATLATFNYPQGLLAAPNGDIYIVDSLNNVVRKVSAATGIINTIAGTGSGTYGGDGGPATLAGISNPTFVALDASGNLYIAEKGSNHIRKVDPTGTISTFAGNGNSAYGGDGGPATLASFSDPYGVAVDSSGNVYFPDGNGAVRKVNANGIISTVAGTGVPGYSGDGGPATLAQTQYPDSLHFDPSGNLYFYDDPNCRLRRVDATTGIITTVVGHGSCGASPAGGPATLASTGDVDGGIAFCNGNMYLSDENGLLQYMDPGGILHTIGGNATFSSSGDGGPVSLCQIVPFTVAFDQAGNLYVSDYAADRVRKVQACAAVPTPTPTAASAYPGSNPPGPGECFIYPSPARGTTATVCYNMAGPGQVEIKAWNWRAGLAGQWADTKGAGVQTTPLDLSGFAPGVYFYEITFTYASGRKDKCGPHKFAVIR